MRALVSPSRVFAWLFLSTVLSVAAQGVVDPGSVRNVLVTALSATSLLLALRAAELKPPILFEAAAAAAAGIVLLSVLRALGLDIGEGAARTMNAALVSLAPPAVAVAIVRDLRSSGQVRLSAVAGVLSLYMLIGMAFAFTYGAIDHFGDTFFANGEPATVSNCLYFSFSTLTTVGYGDFVAVTEVGHTLAVFEMLIGQIYLVTIVSLIVSNLGQPARRPRT